MFQYVDSDFADNDEDHFELLLKMKIGTLQMFIHIQIMQIKTYLWFHRQSTNFMSSILLALSLTLLNPESMEDRFTLEWCRQAQNSGRTDDSVHYHSTTSTFERACAVREFLNMGPQLHITCLQLMHVCLNMLTKHLMDATKFSPCYFCIR